MAAKFELKVTAKKNWLFNLKAANHQIIGTSQMYASETARDAGIASVKANGGTQTVKDLT